MDANAGFLRNAIRPNAAAMDAKPSSTISGRTLAVFGNCLVWSSANCLVWSSAWWALA